MFSYQGYLNFIVQLSSVNFISILNIIKYRGNMRKEFDAGNVKYVAEIYDDMISVIKRVYPVPGYGNHYEVIYNVTESMIENIIVTDNFALPLTQPTGSYTVGEKTITKDHYDKIRKEVEEMFKSEKTALDIYKFIVSVYVSM